MLRKNGWIGTLFVAAACGRVTSSAPGTASGGHDGGSSVGGAVPWVTSGGASVGGDARVGGRGGFVAPSAGGAGPTTGCGDVTEALGSVPMRSNAIFSDGPTLYLGGVTLVALDKVTRERTEFSVGTPGFQHVSAIAADAASLYLGFLDGSIAKLSKQGGELVELRTPPSSRRPVSVLIVNDGTLLSQTGVRVTAEDLDSSTGPWLDLEGAAAAWDGSFIYYTAGEGLFRASRSSRGSSEMLAGLPSDPILALVLSGDFAYFSAQNASGSITLFRVAKSGGTTEALASPDDSDDFRFVVLPAAVYWQSPAGALYKTALGPDGAGVPRRVAQYGPFDTDDYRVLLTADEHAVFWVASEDPLGPNEDEGDTLTLLSTCVD